MLFLCLVQQCCFSVLCCSTMLFLCLVLFNNVVVVVVFSSALAVPRFTSGDGGDMKCRKKDRQLSMMDRAEKKPWRKRKPSVAVVHLPHAEEMSVKRHDSPSKARLPSAASHLPKCLYVIQKTQNATLHTT